jgi:hypothetical protein
VHQAAGDRVVVDQVTVPGGSGVGLIDPEETAITARSTRPVSSSDSATASEGVYRLSRPYLATYAS